MDKIAHNKRPTTRSSRERALERLRQLSTEIDLLVDEIYADAVKNRIRKPLIESVKNASKMRLVRAKYIDQDLLGEPAWDMMLELFRAHLSGEIVSTGDICLASGAPHSTSLRWVIRMMEAGYFVREVDPEDSRRTVVSLSEDAVQRMKLLFAEYDERGLF